MDQKIIYVHTDISYSKTANLVFNEYGQLLVLRRSEWKKIPGQYYRPDLSHKPDLPGGLIGDEDELESERVGSARELAEETGIEIDDSALKLLYCDTRYKPNENISETRLVYLLKLDYTPEITLSWEHESYEWLDPISVAEQCLLSGARHKALVYLIEHRNLFGI